MIIQEKTKEAFTTFDKVNSIKTDETYFLAGVKFAEHEIEDAALKFADFVIKEYSGIDVFYEDGEVYKQFLKREKS
jgi:hypothetical protein